MDNKTAQEILSAYRPNGQDAKDKFFNEALDQCRNDPAMAEWLKEERRFDTAAIAALEGVPVPQTGKQRLLQADPALLASQESDKQSDGSTRFRVAYWWAGWGIAALLLISFVLVQVLPNPQPAQIAKEDFTLAGLVSEAMPLSYRSNEPQSVLNWLASRDAPVPEAFPGSLQEASALGCRIFKVPGGGEISLLCMLKNGEVVHFFVFDEKASALLAYAPDNTWWEESGWNMYAYTEGNRRIAMATQGDPHSLL